MNPSAALEGDQLIATRYLDAEPALVWKAFTSPEHLAAFWGGDHASVNPESVVVDLRVGGVFHLECRDGQGCTHPLDFRYEVIEAPNRLVFSEPQTGLTTEIRLEPTRRGTRVVVHQTRVPPDLRTEQARQGLAGILRQLEVVVRALTTSQEKGTT